MKQIAVLWNAVTVGVAQAGYAFDSAQQCDFALEVRASGGGTTVDVTMETSFDDGATWVQWDGVPSQSIVGDGALSLSIATHPGGLVRPMVSIAGTYTSVTVRLATNPKE